MTSAAAESTHQDLAAFESALRADGYLDIEKKTVEAGKYAAEHHHDFDVRALVLAGSAVIACNGEPRTYRPGDVLIVDAGTPHTEHYGPEGYTALVGRRHSPV